MERCFYTSIFLIAAPSLTEPGFITLALIPRQLSDLPTGELTNPAASCPKGDTALTYQTP
jgi:hypothetical protein